MVKKDETCQFCGAPIMNESWYGEFISYECGTLTNDPHPRTSRCCLGIQIKRQKELNQHLRDNISCLLKQRNNYAGEVLNLRWESAQQQARLEQADGVFSICRELFEKTGGYSALSVGEVDGFLGDLEEALDDYDGKVRVKVIVIETETQEFTEAKITEVFSALM